MKTLDMVAEFHTAMDVPVLREPALPAPDRRALRATLMNEELKELHEALLSGSLHEVAKEACDLQYVIDGTYLEFGLGAHKIASPLIPYQQPEMVDDREADCIADSLTSALETVVLAMQRGDLNQLTILLNCLQMILDASLALLGMGGLKHELFLKVHNSNMSKLGEDGRPLRRPDGKVLKGPRYLPPDLLPLVIPIH